MLSGQKAKDLMSAERCLTAFISRANDAYVMSHTIYDLVNDPDYRKLTIKHGKAVGTPLGSKHILPGYWFTVFVATQESFQHVIEAMRNEAEFKEKLTGLSEKDKEELFSAVEKFKQSAGIGKIKPLVEKFQINLDVLVNALGKFENCTNTFPNKKPLKRIAQSIATGSYEFNDDNDLMCTFYDNDALCGYCFEATVNVAEFTQFSIDFSKQLIELLRPIINNHQGIREEVAKMLIGDILSMERS